MPARVGGDLCSVIPSAVEGPAFRRESLVTLHAASVGPIDEPNSRSFDFTKGLASESLPSAQNDNAEKVPQETTMSKDSCPG